ncbi:hypothetical protein IJT93_06005 [bacterium]|nr:hypothetical protein [bacterium]
MTHYSAQIGRFCENGVSFTVPMISRTQSMSGEDRFWELRRGIGEAVVVVLAEAESASDSKTFRSNMTLTKVDLEGAKLNAEVFCKEQTEALRKEGFAQKIESGSDGVGPWVSFSQEKNGLPIACKAWFFVYNRDNAQPEGYVLLGSAWQGSPALKDTMTKFAEVAATVKFGSFESGFVKHAAALSDAAASLSEGGLKSVSAAADKAAAPEPGKGAEITGNNSEAPSAEPSKEQAD